MGPRKPEGEYIAKGVGGRESDGRDTRDRRGVTVTLFGHIVGA